MSPITKVLETAEWESADPTTPIVEKRKYEYVWRSIIVLAVIHAGALYGVWLLLSGQVMLKTILFG